MVAAGDFVLPRAYRQQARVWSETEFKAYLDKITRKVAIHPLEAPEVDLGLQLPHRGTLVRQDIMQLAHAFMLRKFLGKGDERFVSTRTNQTTSETAASQKARRHLSRPQASRPAPAQQ
ncbi:hypothetical protein K4F85_00255 [Phaeobacter inhibens]|uniref:hypothetical protein n=1 Tax=Phaeobacter inhibens TaxID=221822 RepID=UPI0021A50FD4|nr:hypothetical protein [Phaeobacter inhibens]UWR41373.1 hypothetical protein K4F85_00255 [Phaeobacter inhibens]